MKRRFSVTLSEETVREFKEISKSVGLRPGAMSALCEESIQKTTDMMKEFIARHHDKGSLSIGDLFSVMGEQLEKMEKEERERDEKQEQVSAPRNKRIR